MSAPTSRPLLAGRGDPGDGGRGLGPVAPAGGFQVVDLDGHAAFTADLDRLVDRLEQVVGLGTNVRDVHAAKRSHDFRQLDQVRVATKLSGG